MNALVLIGWLGTALYLANHSYIALAREWDRTVYYGLNFLAASMLVLCSFVSESWQAVVINGFWSGISLLLLLGVRLDGLPISHRLFFWPLLGLWLWLVVESVMQREFDFSLLAWSSAFTFSMVYLLFCSRRLDERQFLIWNIYASLSLLPQLWLDRNWPVFALEAAWAGISCWGAMRKYRSVHLVD